MAAVLVLAAGGFGLSRVTGSSSSSSAAEGSAACPASTFAGTAAGAAVPSSQTHAVPAIEAPRNFPVVNSTTDYQRATLRQQLETELRRHAGRALGPQALAPGSLKGCVQRVTAGTVPGILVLVERAHFQGQPAIVIVAVQGDHDAAWVVASGCSASTAHILATATLPGTSEP